MMAPLMEFPVGTAVTAILMVSTFLFVHGTGVGGGVVPIAAPFHLEIHRLLNR